MAQSCHLTVSRKPTPPVGAPNSQAALQGSEGDQAWFRSVIQNGATTHMVKV